MFASAWAVDVLEKGESFNPQLVAVLGDESAKAQHKQPKHLVDVDNHQGAITGQPQAFQCRCKRWIGRFRHDLQLG